ncbi:hypothetical protein Tco_1465173 [Tanacetum coccineum]
MRPCLYRSHEPMSPWSRESMSPSEEEGFSQARQVVTHIYYQRKACTLLVHYILHGLSSKTRALWELSCLLEAARQSLACIRLCLVCPSCLLEAVCKSLACIRLCPRGQSCLHAPSTGCGPDVCDIRTSYISHQCTSSDGDSAAPCLLRGLATPDWLLLAS